MTVSWKCRICNNIFRFNNNDDRMLFMREHSTICCRVTYPNGITAYVGPSNGTFIRAINEMMPVGLDNRNIQPTNINTNIRSSTPISSIYSANNNNVNSWISTPENLGYATARILMVLDTYNIILEQELPSLTYIGTRALITELDREKAIKIYCTTNSLFEAVKRIVYIDDLLYSILVDDEQIMRTMQHITTNTGRRRYYINTNSRNMYARQIACALRRLDKLSHNNDI